ncbi:protein B4-like [Salvelinus namaycush]|uniref:Protein B4-like n=1 Tax=Salvelinus namaycush TaxID=8040 RepID=A0A8U0PB64_SALNM|nr:protein B4-like [Salvelinus namaycush]
MPPKKKAAAAEEVTSSSDVPKKYEKVSGKAKPESSNAPAVARRTPLHPPTMVIVNEALKELDSRKGVSSQAIRGFITEKYPSVDLVRLKYMIRKTLKKGFEGVQGRFRLAVRGRIKEPKPKATENTDPNVEKAPKAAKVGAKKTKDKEASQVEEDNGEEGTAEDQPKAQKTTKGEGAAKKGAKAKAFQKPAKGDEGDTAAPEAKTTGKRGKGGSSRISVGGS